MAAANRADIIRAIFAAYLSNDRKAVEARSGRFPLHQSL